MARFWTVPSALTSRTASVNFSVGTRKVMVPFRSEPVSALAAEPEM